MVSRSLLNVVNSFEIIEFDVIILDPTSLSPTHSTITIANPVPARTCISPICRSTSLACSRRNSIGACCPHNKQKETADSLSKRHFVHSHFAGISHSIYYICTSGMGNCAPIDTGAFSVSALQCNLKIRWLDVPSQPSGGVGMKSKLKY